jgi:putative DNA primase/helicase
MSALQDHGIELPPGASGEVRTYCPQCAEHHRTRSKTLGVSIEDGVFHCFRCGWKGRVGGNILPFEPVKRARDLGQERQARDKRARAIRKILKECRPLAESRIGQDYLRYRLQRELTEWPRLGFHPALSYFETAEGGRRGESYPALVATVRNVRGEIVTLHRTYLAKDGNGKAPVTSPKKLMAPPRGTVTGCCVRLYETARELHVAEGIETALAVYVALGEPVWSTISAYGLATVELPPEVRAVHIWADFDRSGAGQDAALACRKRLEREGRRVAVHFPKKLGQDWLDVLREGRL